MKFFRRRNVRKYTRRPAKRTVRRAIAKSRSKIFKKKVLSVIHKQAENKIARTVNMGLSTSVIAVPDAPRVTGVDCFQIVPNISTTPAAGTFYRLGEKVKAISLMVKGYYIYQPSVTVSSENFNHMKLRIMCVSPKNVRDLTSITSNSGSWIQNLLQNGSTTQQFSNSVTASAYLPFNKENIIKYYDHVFDLNQDYLLQTTAVGITPIITKSLRVNFSFRIPIKNKTLHYDQSINTGLTPTNFNPVLMAGIVQMNGFANTTTKGSLFYTSELQYEDL